MLQWRWVAVLLVLGIFCWNNVFTIHPMLSNLLIVNLQDNDSGYSPSSSRSRKPPSFLFPSKEERLRYYMGDWYIISSSWNDSASFCNDIPYYNSTLWYDSHDTAFLFDAVNVQNYSYRHYTKDIQKYLFSTASKTKAAAAGTSNSNHSNNDNLLPRLAISVGDQHPSLQHPIILKSRELKGIHKRMEEHVNAKMPILALMNEKRHYSKVSQLKRRRYWTMLLAEKGGGYHRPWHLKRDVLVWRGAATGIGNSVKRKALVEQFLNLQQNEQNQDDSNNKMMIDIAFEPKLSIRQLLQHKYLLSLEGNDVASGLKWMLYSNSVVFMPPPTHVSWAMEDRLVPYFHYIPVLANLSDLPKQVEWAKRHDAECHTISRQATQYMEDLYISHTAKRENRWIMGQIARRYHEQFGAVTSKCPKETQNK